MSFKSFTTPAGRKVIATVENGKYGKKVTHYGLANNGSDWSKGETLVVTYSTPVRTRDLLGGSHGVTAWRGNTRDHLGRCEGPHGQIVQGLAAARRAALAHIDTLELPERGCRIHTLEDAVTAPDQEPRCQHCVTRMRSHVLAMTAQVG